MKPIYQFLLWDNCTNNCKFCLQRENARIFNINQQQIILNNILNFINSNKFKNNSHILLVGGQIFDNINLNDILLSFFKKIINLMVNDIIDLLYINSNLIYKNQLLFQFLNLFNQHKLFNRLKFTTSYDIYGRFNNNQKQLLMLNNLKKIKTNFNECNIVVNTILTKQCCYEILNNKFNIFQFMKEYNVYLKLLPLIQGNQQLLAQRNLVLKTLLYINNQNPEYINYYIKDTSLNQQRYLYVYKNNKLQLNNCKINNCGHSYNFTKYSQKNTCFCCDIKNLFTYEI